MKKRGRGGAGRGESVAARGSRAGTVRGKKFSSTGDRINPQRRTSARNVARRGGFLQVGSSRLDELRNRYANRRNIIFKSCCPSKSPHARAQIRFVEHVWYTDIKYKIGDIIAITDKEDNLQYFAQIRGLMVNPMMDAFASLTWLIPKKSATDPHNFDADRFAHGLVDAENYPIKICEWISSRPPHPAYKKYWTQEKIAASTTRANLEAKWEQLQRVAKEELLRINQKPLINLIEAKNEEGVQHL